jgi:hypothetical protein
VNVNFLRNCKVFGIYEDLISKMSILVLIITLPFGCFGVFTMGFPLLMGIVVEHHDSNKS